MNMQKRPPSEVAQIFLDCGVDTNELEYYAWPQMFGSTCGPRRGVGGAAMSVFTVEAWTNMVVTVYLCAGMYSLSRDRFETLTTVSRWSLLPTTEQHGEVTP